MSLSTMSSSGAVSAALSASSLFSPSSHRDELLLSQYSSSLHQLPRRAHCSSMPHAALTIPKTNNGLPTGLRIRGPLPKGLWIPASGMLRSSRRFMRWINRVTVSSRLWWWVARGSVALQRLFRGHSRSAAASGSGFNRRFRCWCTVCRRICCSVQASRCWLTVLSRRRV